MGSGFQPSMPHHIQSQCSQFWRVPSTLSSVRGWGQYGTLSGRLFPEKPKLAQEPVACGAYCPDKGGTEGFDVNGPRAVYELLERSRGDEEGGGVTEKFLRDIDPVDPGEHLAGHPTSAGHRPNVRAGLIRIGRVLI